MKLFKKRHLLLIFVVFCLSACGGSGTKNASAQVNEKEGKKAWSKDFAVWMQKAKEYEEAKNWIWALNSYYNALEAWEDWDEAKAAYIAWADLANVILGGNPGRGNFDSFSMYEEWKKLLIETEKYGNQTFPYELYFGSFHASKLNLAEKSADYVVPINFRQSTRYFKTVDIVAKGYANVDRSSWTDLPKEFPGSPLTKESLSIKLLHHNFERKSSFAFLVGDLRFPTSHTVIPYEGVFLILDNDENILAESEPYVIGTRTADAKEENLFLGLIASSYLEALLPFKNVPEHVVKMIEAGNAHVGVKNISVMYGNLEAELNWEAKRYIRGGGRQNCFVSSADINYQGSGICSRAKYAFVNIELDAAIRAHYKEKVGKGKILKCYLLDTDEACRLFLGRGFEDHLTNGELVVLCNEFSKMMGREPLYEYNGSIDLCDVAVGGENDFKNVSCVANATGFRIPTLSDLKTCLSYFNELPPLKNTGVFAPVYNYRAVDAGYSTNANILLYCLDDK